MTASRLLGVILAIVIAIAAWERRSERADEQSQLIQSEVLSRLSTIDLYEKHRAYLNPLVVSAHESAFSVAYAGGSSSRSATPEMRKESFNEDRYMRALRLGVGSLIRQDIDAARDMTRIKELRRVKEAVRKIWLDMGYKPIF